MLLRITCAGLLMILLPFVATAQEAKTVEELDKEIQDLKTEISELKGLITQAGKAASDNKTSIESMRAEIRKGLGDLTELVREQSVQQREVLESMSGADALRLNANMESNPEFRQELRKAVHDSLDEEGEVIISNKMPTEQQVKVNQTNHVIGPGATVTVNVPVGTVTAQLPGQPITNWTIAAPKYQQKIDIVPDQTVTVYRPTETATVTTLRPLGTTVTTLRPLYTPATPIYVSPVVTSYYDPFTGYWWSY